MSADNSSAPAFPGSEKNGDGSHYYSHPGLTKRELLAATVRVVDVKFDDFAQAAVALGLSAPGFGDLKGFLEFGIEVDAALRVRQADALLAELAKGGDE